jgi:DNA-binding transcriptional ArsR family regulator
MEQDPLVRSLEPAALVRAADIIRMLGHPERLKIVEVLEGGEATVSDIMAQLGLAQPVVSQQLARMRSCDIVAPRREGVHVYYRIIEPKVAQVLD